MLWIFVGIGLVAFVAAAFGFLTTVQSRTALSALHFAALFTISLAWVYGHHAALGWTSIALTLLIEAVAWTRFYLLMQRPSPLPILEITPEEPAPQHVEPPIQSPQYIEPVSPAPPPCLLLTLSSLALLREKSPVASNVFLASLRRGGLRDARLVESISPSVFRVQTAAMILEVRCDAAPLDPDVLTYCLTQSFDWPEAEQAVRDHRAHVTFTTTAAADSSRSEWVRLHARAHLALAEFIPLIALAWPDAGRLLPPENIRKLLETRIDPADSCVTLRTFPLDDPPGSILSDTVGLHALGLRDFQIVTPAEPDDAVASLLFTLVEQSFQMAADPDNGQTFPLGDESRWTASYGRSRFKPDRPVIDLLPVAASDDLGPTL